MNQFNVFTSDERSDLYYISKAFGRPLSNWQYYQNQIRLEAVLDPTQKTYRFDMYNGNTQRRPDEILLSRNDLFYASHVGIRIGRRESGDETGLQVHNSQEYTYPDSNIFNGAAVGGANEQQSLQAIYGALMTIRTDTVERIREFSTQFLEWIPEYQNRNGNVLTAPNGADQTFDNRYLAQFGAEMDKRGFKKITPVIGFDGQRDNTVMITLPSNALIGNINGDTNAAGTAGQGNKNILIVELFGWTIVQGADPITK